MKQKKILNTILLALLCCSLATTASAKVSQAEADRLGKDLTPYGAEMAGNADGSIPAWTGGVTKHPEGKKHKNGDFYEDLYAADKKLFSITAANMAEYAENLTEGSKAMLAKYPDSYRLDVYQTRRTAAAPEWVYENTKKNATRASMTEDMQGITGGFGGIPFPIPQSAEEVMYNHLTRWKGRTAWANATLSYMVTPRTGPAVSGGGQTLEQYPFYEEGVTAETYDGVLWKFYQALKTPARRKGELLIAVDYANAYETPRKAWQYLPGQRRVRRAPTIAYDTPNPGTSGLSTYDEGYMFNGALDRYDWKLVGKKEVYVPYNNNGVPLVPVADLLKPYHVNPDHVRFEKHRMWVVEATLKEGKRHVYAKRTFYIDEDSWTLLMADNYDGKGNLWRTSYGTSQYYYDLPLYRTLENFFYDLQTDTYAVSGMSNETGEFIYFGDLEDVPHKVFTPENLRRQGRR